MLSPLARQIAALGLALCAVALSLAYPLRNYLQQQVAERQAVAEQHQLEDEIADLKAQKAALSDPAYIKAEAKKRLQYVSPGDTVYVVKLPPAVKDAAVTTGATPPTDAEQSGADDASGVPDSGAPATGADSGTDTAPWYSDLWDTVAGDDAATPAAGR